MWTAPHETLSRDVFLAQRWINLPECCSLVRHGHTQSGAMEISRFCTFGPFLQDVLLAAPALQFLDQMGHTTPKVLADQLCKAFGRNSLLVMEALIESDSYIFIFLFPPLGGQIMKFSSHRAQMQKESRQASMVYGHLTCLAVLLIKRPPWFCRNASKHSARVSGCKKGFSKGATRVDVKYHARLDIVFGHLSWTSNE